MMTMMAFPITVRPAKTLSVGHNFSMLIDQNGALQVYGSDQYMQVLQTPTHRGASVEQGGGRLYKSMRHRLGGGDSLKQDGDTDPYLNDLPVRATPMWRWAGLTFAPSKMVKSRAHMKAMKRTLGLMTVT